MAPVYGAGRLRSLDSASWIQQRGCNEPQGVEREAT